MSGRLDSKAQIHTLAADLGLRYSDKPTQAILRLVETRVRDISEKFECKTLRELLIAIANEVGTVFKEVHSEQDVRTLQRQYVPKGVLIFANLDSELSRPDDYGLTIGVENGPAWEPRFVSVIDCRGDKAFRTYFTKWHELAHLLTLTPQMRLLFRRSHSRENSADPEERFMDVIASAVGFLPDFLPVSARGDLSFEAIAEIKKEFCPDSSMQAATIGIVKALPGPCLLLDAVMGLRKDEAARMAQFGLGFLPPPTPALRALHVTVNNAARLLGIQVHRNMRIPESSIISRVHTNGGYAEAVEDLSSWTSSDGSRLEGQTVRVKARKRGELVQVLMIPVDSL